MGKITETRKLYKDTLKEITKSIDNWQNFLNSASWNFKYDFDDQILIYAQNPQAKACASMSEWNKKLKRWINSGTKPIFVLDKNSNSEYPFRLVFDIADTYNARGTEYKLWELSKEYEQDVIDSLEANFGEIDNKETIEKAIVSTSYNLTVDNIEDYIEAIIDHKENTNFENMSNNEIKSIVLATTWASVSYMIMNRCGLKTNIVSNDEFSYINFFESQELATILGTCISDIAEAGLREIARTIFYLKNKDRTIENVSEKMYPKNNIENKEEDEKDGENRIHENRGLLSTQLDNAKREDSSREVFTHEIQLFEEPQETRINNVNNEQELKPTLDRNSGESQRTSGEISRTDGETRWDNRRIENKESNEMGRVNEQLQNDSRGNSEQGIDLYIENSSKRRVLSDSEMDSKIDFLQDQYTSMLLSNIQNLKVSKNEIKEFYEKHLSLEERADFIKQVFDDAYNEIVVDDIRLGYKTYENVLHLWKDNYLNRTAEVYYKWDMVADYINGLIMVNEFNDLHKPLPSYNDQMQILQAEAENAPAFSFTQELIDYALQIGSNVRDSKMRIYHQFEESLSSKDNIQFLKNEYGWGGCSSIHIGTRIGIDYDGKGITLRRGYKDDEPKILIAWDKVEKRISELIKAERYLNPKEKEEYSNWLIKKEQEKELSESAKRLENVQVKTQEDELAERIYSFIKPFELYSYTDDSAVLNSDEENIEIVKADINDSRNISDYVSALQDLLSRLENSDTNKSEIKDLISILEKRIPHYEYHLGDKVYIGADEYEFAGIKENIVTLYDPKFPLLNKQIDFKEFERKVQDNYANDHLKVENNTQKETENIIIHEVDDTQEQEINELKEEEKPYKVGQEVYLESDRKYRIDSIDIEKDKISLLDLQINYPIFREESILKFENLYYQNERNYPKEEIKPNFVKSSNKIQDFVLHPEVPINDRNNYKITDNNLGVGTLKEKFERNIEAIKVLKKCEQENRYATPEEQEILSKYVGWGGLQQAFKEDDVSWANEYKILKELLNDEEYKNARSSVLTAFYTPPVVINAMYETLKNMGLKEANILEPSCGIGNFFGMLPKELENCRMYGIEIDSISGRIAQQLYQKSTIAINAYEKVELPDSFFDVAVRKCTF